MHYGGGSVSRAVAIVRVCRISSVSAAQIGTDQNMVTHLTLTLTHTAPIICLRSLASVFLQYRLQIQQREYSLLAFAYYILLH